MEKTEIKQGIRKYIEKTHHRTIEDENENFFSKNINIPPIDMVYILHELSEMYGFRINDQMMEHLPVITLNTLTDSIWKAVC